MKRYQKILITILILGVLVVIGFNVFSNRVVNSARELTYQDIALEALADGTYQGSYELMPVSVEVETEIEDGRIVAVEIVEHFNGLGSQAEAVVDEMIEQQEIDVDTISGATLSSIVIKKAVEDSLLP